MQRLTGQISFPGNIRLVTIYAYVGPMKGRPTCSACIVFLNISAHNVERLVGPKQKRRARTISVCLSKVSVCLSVCMCLPVRVPFSSSLSLQARRIELPLILVFLWRSLLRAYIHAFPTIPAFSMFSSPSIPPGLQCTTEKHKTIPPDPLQSYQQADEQPRDRPPPQAPGHRCLKRVELSTTLPS